MIIFFSEGRLGNQIFQYAFLKTIRQRNEKIAVFVFHEIKQVFEKIDVINLRCKNKIIEYVLKPVLCFFCRLKLISSILVNTELVNITGHIYIREAPGFILKKGLFPVKYVKRGFFQSEHFFNKKVVETLMIKHVFIEQAKLFLKMIPENNKKIFVHIRRGDYKNYYIYDKMTLLPISYFHRQIKHFIEKDKNSYFIFISDESDFIETEFFYV
jgi:hypothetical protein